jgi:hypothetical protein
LAARGTHADQIIMAIELDDGVLANFETENARLRRELSEAHQQQIATADVLLIFSSSHGELQLVFEAMLASATRLCEASYGALWLSEGDALNCGTPRCSAGRLC